MLKVEGYKMFYGTMRITPKSKCISPMEITAEWLYKPDTECWYGAGRSFCKEICTVIEDFTKI